MNRHSRVPSLVLAALVAAGLSACAGKEAEHRDDAHDERRAREAAHEDAGHGGEDEHGEGEAGALPLADVRGVAFSEVGAPREEGAWFAAEAISEPSAEAALSAPVAGRIAAIHAGAGTAVRSGEAVVEIVSPELADLRSAWLAAGARRTRAEADLARERRLLAAEATARRDVEAAEAEAAVAAAEEEAARLALAGRGIEPGAAGARLAVRAPRDGVVSALEVALGESVESGRTLGRIVAPGAALVRVELPLPGPEGWVRGATTEARRSDGRRWRATVEGTPPELSAATRRLAYRLRLEGEELPLAGTPLEVRVPLARAIVLPQDALQLVEGTWGVFVRTGGREGDAAEFRPVRKGAELGRDVLVLEGVDAGESVATEGAYLLKALWLKRAGGGGHHDH